MIANRRAFVHAETMRLGVFLAGDDDRTLVGWMRSYRCECGFRCTGAGEIYDHAAICGMPPAGQQELFR